MNILHRVKTILDKSLELLTMVSLGVLVVDVVWQIVTRFVLNNPSSWTEEFSTFLLMWVGLLGAAVAVNRKAHLGVDFFVLKLSFRVQIAVELIVYLIVGVFTVAVMIIGGIELVQTTLSTNQVSPALNWKMGYVYLCLPISGFFIAFYSALFFSNAITKLWKRERAQV
ncbi:MAG: TRAP transporter small permease [Chitinispirillaceae bacterium]|nr:TRAP transporter small permease [Chitinispirillaceae bacterium]